MNYTILHLALSIAPLGEGGKSANFELEKIMQELEKSMYFGATPSTLEKARILRNKMTPEEILLWERLNRKQICNIRFRRQHPINTFIADFYCHAAKIVVELDGRIHLKSKEYDKERTLIIEQFKIKVIRFTNAEITSDIDKVIEEITEKVKKAIGKLNL